MAPDPKHPCGRIVDQHPRDLRAEKRDRRLSHGLEHPFAVRGSGDHARHAREHRELLRPRVAYLGKRAHGALRPLALGDVEHDADGGHTTPPRDRRDEALHGHERAVDALGLELVPRGHGLPALLRASHVEDARAIVRRHVVDGAQTEQLGGTLVAQEAGDGLIGVADHPGLVDHDALERAFDDGRVLLGLQAKSGVDPMALHDMRQRAREPQRPAPAHHAAIVGALVVGAAGQAGVVTSGEGDEGHRGVRGVDLAEGVRLRGLGHREIEERDVNVSFGQALDGLGHRADVVDLDAGRPAPIEGGHERAGGGGIGLDQKDPQARLDGRIESRPVRELRSSRRLKARGLLILPRVDVLSDATRRLCSGHRHSLTTSGHAPPRTADVAIISSGSGSPRMRNRRRRRKALHHRCGRLVPGPATGCGREVTGELGPGEIAEGAEKRADGDPPGLEPGAGRAEEAVDQIALAVGGDRYPVCHEVHDDREAQHRLQLRPNHRSPLLSVRCCP